MPANAKYLRFQTVRILRGRSPVHHKAAQYLDAYIKAAELGEASPRSVLFRASENRSTLSKRPMSPRTVLAMVKRRAADAGLDPSRVCNHTFRATGITAYMANGGSLEVAAQIAGHAQTTTTQLYNRNSERVAQGEIERIPI